MDAESRAEYAEGKVRVMERRINETEWILSPEITKDDCEPIIKDNIIRSLESEVEEQRRLRLADAKEVEAKAARIKEWVTNKLRDLERQNAHLKLQNAHCNDQMELLRVRLEQLQAMGSVCRNTKNTRQASIAEDSSLGSFEGDPLRSEESLPELGNGIKPHEALYARVEKKQGRSTVQKVQSSPLYEAAATSTIHQQAERVKSVDPLALMQVNDSKFCNSSEINHYSEIYTPCTDPQETVWCSSSCQDNATSASGRTASGDSGLVSEAPPPPPEHRRVSSLEDNIYRVASQAVSETMCEAIINAAEKRHHSGTMPDDVTSSVASSGGARVCQRSSIVDDDDDEYADSVVPPKIRTSYLLPRSSADDSLVTTAYSKLDGEDLKKSGYLNKLNDGKIKSTWKRRYFVLKSNNVLSYWKSQHDCHRKPQGTLVMDESCRITKSPDLINTFEIVCQNNSRLKKLHLSADSLPLAEAWVILLQECVQRSTLQFLLDQKTSVQPTLATWLVRVKEGRSRRCWAKLIDNIFVYYRNPTEQNSLGQINMRDTHVKEVNHLSSSSDDDESSGSDCSENKPNVSYTLGIFPNHVMSGQPTYLTLSTRSELERWLYELTIVSGGNPQQNTPFEQLIQELMEEGGHNSAPGWKSHLLTSLKEATTPLTTYTSETLQAEALKLHKSLQLFTSVVLESAGIDYHVILAANAFQKCLDCTALQPELLCCLIRHTFQRGDHQNCIEVGKHTGLKQTRSLLASATYLFSCESPVTCQRVVSPPSSQIHTPTFNNRHYNDLKTNEAENCALMQAWMLMALAVSIFVPKDARLLWFLRLHFRRHMDTRSEVGKYAIYCNRALERAITNGCRYAKPSRTEVLSIFLKNPQHHSMPHAIPVHFLNQTYHVIGFDGSSTVGEVLQQLTADMGIRPTAVSGFSLFSDDPLIDDFDHALHFDDKLCDVISRWETLLREKGTGKFENKRVIRFILKNRIYFRLNVTEPSEAMGVETEKERLLFIYQVNQQIVKGMFPINKELAFELAALMSQIHFGDFCINYEKNCSIRISSEDTVAPSIIMSDTSASKALELFFPSRYMDSSNDAEISLVEKWKLLRGKPQADCVRIALTCTRKWPLFGAKLCLVKHRLTANSGSWEDSILCINEDGISLLHVETIHPMLRVSYSQLVSMIVKPSTSDISSTNVGHIEIVKNENSSILLFTLSTSTEMIDEIMRLSFDYMKIVIDEAPALRVVGRHFGSARFGCFQSLFEKIKSN